MLDAVRGVLEDAGWRVYGPGDVPTIPVVPYVLLYALQPSAVRSLARPEAARRFRFGVTLVDLGSQHIEGDADGVEALLEGARPGGPLSRVEWVARGPLTRDAEATVDGQEYHTLPLHFITTIPKGE